MPCWEKRLNKSLLKAPGAIYLLGLAYLYLLPYPPSRCSTCVNCHSYHSARPFHHRCAKPTIVTLITMTSLSIMIASISIFYTLSLAQCHLFWGWASQHSHHRTWARMWSVDRNMDSFRKTIVNQGYRKTHHLAWRWNRQDSLVVRLCGVVSRCQVPHPGHPDNKHDNENNDD